MTRYEQIAARALRDKLANEPAPITLWALSCIADDACRVAGKRRDLYDSLYRYEDLLPSGWSTRWLTALGGTGDGMLMAVPPGWAPGHDMSESMLLGRGRLTYYPAPA